MEMEEFKVKIGEVFSDLDHSWSLNEIVFSKQDKLYKTIRLTAALFVYFLEIHPFANGNGHMARFLLISVMAKFNIYPSKFSIHPRPPDPAYTACIKAYRAGNRALLERFVLDLI